MPTVRSLIAYAQKHKISFHLDQNEIRYKAPRAILTPELLADIATRKAELREYLGAPNGAVCDLHFLANRSEINRGHVLLLTNMARVWNDIRTDRANPLSMNSFHLVASCPSSEVRDRLLAAIRIVACENEALLARVHDHRGLPALDLDEQLEYISGADYPHPASPPLAHVNRASAAVWRPFNFSAEPLLRVFVEECGAGKSLVGIVLHKLACDPRTMDVFERRLIDIYEALKFGGAPRAMKTGITKHFLELNAWLDSADAYAQLLFWMKRLKGAPAYTGLSNPGKPPNPKETSFGHVKIDVNGQLLTHLRSAANSRRVSLFVVLLACHCIALGRVTHSQDLVVSLPYVGRESAEDDKNIAPLVNHLYFRVDLSQYSNDSDTIEGTHLQFMEILSANKLPFEIVSEQALSNEIQTPMFNFFPYDPEQKPRTSPSSIALDWHRISVEPPKNMVRPMHHSLTYAMEMTECESSLTGSLQYRTADVSPTRATEFAREFIATLQTTCNRS